MHLQDIHVRNSFVCETELRLGGKGVKMNTLTEVIAMRSEVDKLLSLVFPTVSDNAI